MTKDFRRRTPRATCGITGPAWVWTT